jgi:hypothetical protein
MKTINVKTAKMQSNDNPAVLRKVSVNQTFSPCRENRASNRLSIRGYEIREWLEYLTSSKGLYFMDIQANSYSMHYSDHDSEKLMALDCQEGLKEPEEILEAMLFDLSLFPDEPILVFDSDKVEKQLRNLAATYYEHARTIDAVMDRLVNIDLKKVFESGMYRDSRVQEISIDGIYQALYAGTSRTFSKEQESYGAYLIFIAIQSIFYQMTGKRVMA